MRIGVLASNTSLAEYFVTAPGLDDHTVTMYSAKQDLFSALAAAASLQGESPHDVLLLEPIVDASGTDTGRAEWSCEGAGTSHHRPHHCGPGRHHRDTTCVAGIVSKAIATSANWQRLRSTKLHNSKEVEPRTT